MTLQQEYREKYNEGLEVGIEQGLEKGIERGIKVLYYDVQMTIPEIAAKMSVPEELVEKIVAGFVQVGEEKS